MRHVCRFQFRGQLPLPLVTTILEPDLHLGLGEPQRRRQSGAFRRGQVAFHVERALQLEHLRPREHRSRLLLPFHAAGIAAIDADLDAVVSAAAATSPCTTAAATVKAGGVCRLDLAVCLGAVVLIAEIVVALIARGWTPRPV